MLSLKTNFFRFAYNIPSYYKKQNFFLLERALYSFETSIFQYVYQSMYYKTIYLTRISKSQILLGLFQIAIYKLFDNILDADFLNNKRSRGVPDTAVGWTVRGGKSKQWCAQWSQGFVKSNGLLDSYVCAKKFNEIFFKILGDYVSTLRDLIA